MGFEDRHPLQDSIVRLGLAITRITSRFGNGQSGTGCSGRKSATSSSMKNLPYAAKLESSRDNEEISILKGLESRCGKIGLSLEPLSAEMLSRKVLLSRLYFSQTDYSSLLENFAKIRGRSIETGFAEAMYKVV